MDELIFRLMTVDDIEPVLEIERQSFSVPWSKEAFMSELENNLAHYLLAVWAGKIIAYAGAWVIFDEAHITNVAVLPQYRKNSVGEKLMKKMINDVRDKNACSMTLEVRSSNIAGLRLYEKLGFIKAGYRKNYYTSPVEDAVIMWLKAINTDVQLEINPT